MKIMWTIKQHVHNLQPNEGFVMKGKKIQIMQKNLFLSNKVIIFALILSFSWVKYVLD